MSEERSCRLCGCTEHRACYDERGVCGWSERDPSLCTHCDDTAALVLEVLTGTGRSEPIVEGVTYGELTLPVHHFEQLEKILLHLDAVPDALAGAYAITDPAADDDSRGDDSAELVQ